MAFVTTGKNLLLAGTFNPANLDLSLHTADPGANGANEVAGGDYARQVAAFAAPTAGAMALSNQPIFLVPAGTTLTHVGVWQDATFVGVANVIDETFGGAGQYKVLSGSLHLNAVA